MTPAERQQRRRRRLAKEARAVEITVKRERNEARYADPARRRRQAERGAASSAKHEAEHKEWVGLYGKAQLPDANGPADELARQIDEYLAQCPEITISDVRAAIDRRFGKPA